MKAVETALKSKKEIIGATPPKHNKVLHKVAVNASRKAIAQAHAEVLREILAKFITTVYEVDSRGNPWNVSTYGRIEIPVPWSRNGATVWGVRRTHAEILRRTLMNSQNSRPPFIFDEIERRWYLAISAYPTRATALQWLDEFNINGDLWNVMYTNWKTSQKTRPK